VRAPLGLEARELGFGLEELGTEGGRVGPLPDRVDVAGDPSLELDDPLVRGDFGALVSRFSSRAWRCSASSSTAGSRRSCFTDARIRSSASVRGTRIRLSQAAPSLALAQT